MSRPPILLCALLPFACVVVPVPPELGTESDVPATGAQEASAAFDGQSNGMVDQATFEEDQEVFNDVEVIADGLGRCSTRRRACFATRTRSRAAVARSPSCAPVCATRAGTSSLRACRSRAALS